MAKRTLTLGEITAINEHLGKIDKNQLMKEYLILITKIRVIQFLFKIFRENNMTLEQFETELNSNFIDVEKIFK